MPGDTVVMTGVDKLQEGSKIIPTLERASLEQTSREHSN
jgi:hypothetical protein